MHEGWRQTLHHITIHSWKAVWDCTSHNNTFMKGCVRLYITIHSWRAVWATSHNHTFMKGGVRLYITYQYMHERWGGSRSTKPCVFRVKWLQPAMTGTSCARRVRSVRFGVWYGALQCLFRRVCVGLGWFGICGFRSRCNGCMDVY